MSVHSNYVWSQILKELMDGRKRVKVEKEFHDQVDQIDALLKNDTSALIATMVNFMVESATVDYRFETGNENFDERLDKWKTSINKDVNVDIPRGLRAVSQQYFKERWRSSLVVLNVQWGKVDDYILPVNMWFNDGGHITVEGKADKLDGYKYLVGRKEPKPLVESKNKSILVRKPFDAWYTKYPTPYLVKKGALYHALVKTEIVLKQADLIDSIVPHILLAKAGNDKQAMADNLPTQEELIDLKQEVVKMTNDYNNSLTDGTNVGAFSYDVELNNLIPDLTKFLNTTILNPSDRNLLSALGLIELEGFSKSRQETILNPKVMVEEVVDAVLDWREMLYEVALEIVERNQKQHPKVEKDIKVIPGIIKAFLTNDDKVLIRSAFDRGSIGHQDFIEILPFDFNVSLERRKSERDNGIDEILYPHAIMNQEDVNDEGDNPEETKEETPEKKKTEKDIDASTELIQCQSCKNMVDYLKEPENHMGSIECPYCGKTIDQTGKVYSKFNEIEDISKLGRSVKAEVQYECECLKCGKVVKSTKHCKDIKCSCGGEMRRKDRPGTGDKASEENINTTYKTIDDLPEELKASMTIAEQIKYVQKLNK